MDWIRLLKAISKGLIFTFWAFVAVALGWLLWQAKYIVLPFALVISTAIYYDKILKQ